MKIAEIVKVFSSAIGGISCISFVIQTGQIKEKGARFMGDRFELSFKNKVVRMLFFIMVPTIVAVILLSLITEIPTIYMTFLPLVSWSSFFIWLYFYKRKQKKTESVT